jgi:competence ComEA-like helix-hairpin-helix protein
MSEHDERTEDMEEPTGLEELAQAKDLSRPGEPESEVAVPEPAVPGEEAVVPEEEGEPPLEAEPEDLPSVEGPLGEGAVEPESVDEAAAQIDLNTATEEDLQQLPGIGGVLAARIVAYRTEVGPFREPPEIMRVSGVSDATYASLAGRLVTTGAEPDGTLEAEMGELAEPAEGGVPAAEMSEADLESELVEPEPIPEAELEAVEPEPMLAREPELGEVEAGEKPPRGPEPPLVEVIPSPFPWGRVLFIGLLSVILGAALALATLYGVNGTLNFRGAAERTVQAEIQRVEGEIDTLGSRLGEVEGRLGAIQELDARLTDTERTVQGLGDELDSMQTQLEEMTTAIGSIQTQLEEITTSIGSMQQEFTNLREDLDGLAEHVSSLDGVIAGLQEQVDGLQSDLEAVSQAAERFDAFLNGLRELLGEPQQQSSPTAPAEPDLTSTPASGQAPSLRPMVTVIPLATPSPTP